MSKPLLSRDDYRRIKNMNRKELSEYLNRVWRRGFEVGKKTIAVPKEPLPEENTDKPTGAE